MLLVRYWKIDCAHTHTHMKLIGDIGGRRLVLQVTRANGKLIGADHRMEVCGPISGDRVAVSQRQREYSIVPLEMLTGHIEVALRRIEVKVVMLDLPDPIASEAANESRAVINCWHIVCIANERHLLVGKYTVVQQVGQVGERIVTLVRLYVHRDAGQSLAALYQCGWNLEASHDTIRFQVDDPNRRLLHLLDVVCAHCQVY